MTAPSSPPRRRPPRGRILLTLLGSATVALALIVTVAGQSASGWDLSFRGTSGGGGTSAGGPYVLEGAIGQPVAGTASAGPYAIESGILGGAIQKFVRYFPFVASDGPIF
jgi:hypothetical protein